MSAAGHLYWSRAPTNPEGSVAPKKISTNTSSPAAAVDADKPWCPIFKWGQRGGTVYLTIFVPCLKGTDDVSIDITDRAVEFRAERVAEFAGGRSAARSYRLQLQLFAEVDASRCVHHLRHDHVRVELAKRRNQPWRSLQAPGVPKNPNERPDFDHVDSDDSDSDSQPTPRPRRATPPDRASGGRGGRGGVVASLLSGCVEAASGALRGLTAAEVALVLLVAAHVLACPFTKVEESFNLQAVHDLLFHRTDIAQYDHHAFPGVVPRTFVGALLLAAASAPAVLALQLAEAPKLYAQVAVRVTLGLASAAATARVHRAVARRFGRQSGLAFLTLSLVQFHPLFYGSRTLPNTFGVLASSLATAAWLEGRHQAALSTLTVGTVIFRFDLLLLLAPLTLLVAARRQLPLATIAATGIGSGAAALLPTLLLDSLLWRRPLWPEGEVLLANTVGNMSANYGTSPAGWYFYSALPRALSLAYPLALASLPLVPRAREYVGVALCFVALYSLLPHKELRFILYAAPLLNAGAAAALAHLFARLPPRNAKTAGRRTAAVLGRAAIAASLAGSLALACCFTAAARLNYPGAHALLALHASSPPRGTRGPRVHVGVEAAISGVSRFLELPPPWQYSKAEGLAPAQLTRFSHLLTGANDDATRDLPGFELAHVERGFTRVAMRPPFLLTEPKINVLRRRKEGAVGRAAAAATEGDYFL